MAMGSMECGMVIVDDSSVLSVVEWVEQSGEGLEVNWMNQRRTERQNRTNVHNMVDGEDELLCQLW